MMDDNLFSRYEFLEEQKGFDQTCNTGGTSSKHRSNFGGPRQQVSIRPGPEKINLQLRSKERL